VRDEAGRERERAKGVFDMPRSPQRFCIEEHRLSSYVSELERNEARNAGENSAAVVEGSVEDPAEILSVDAGAEHVYALSSFARGTRGQRVQVPAVVDV
jgi:hypothetical protein